MRLFLVIAALLAGCSTPGSLKMRASPNTYESKQLPRAVINCMTRNQVYSGGRTPIVTEAPSGDLEFALRSGGELDVFIQVKARTGGSSITAWSLPMAGKGRGQIEGEILQGC